MPVGDVLICDAGCDVKHDNTALTVDIVSITETSELLLPRGVPNIELDVAQVLQKVRSYLWSILAGQSVPC